MIHVMLDIFTGQPYTFDDTKSDPSSQDHAAIVQRVNEVAVSAATKVTASFDGEVLNLFDSVERPTT